MKSVFTQFVCDTFLSSTNAKWKVGMFNVAVLLKKCGVAGNVNMDAFSAKSANHVIFLIFKES